MKHTEVTVTDGTDDVDNLNSKYLKSFRIIPTESNALLVELINNKKKVTDRIAVHIGCTILGLAKLRLMKSLYSFTEYLSLSHIKLLYIGKLHEHNLLLFI